MELSSSKKRCVARPAQERVAQSFFFTSCFTLLRIPGLNFRSCKIFFLLFFDLLTRYLTSFDIPFLPTGFLQSTTLLFAIPTSSNGDNLTNVVLHAVERSSSDFQAHLRD